MTTSFTDEPFDDEPVTPPAAAELESDEPFDDVDEAMPTVHQGAALAVLPPVSDASAPLQALIQISHDALVFAKNLIITDAQSFDLAGRFLEQRKERIRWATSFYEKKVANAYKAWKDLTSERASIVDPEQAAVDIVSARYAAFEKEERRKDEEARRRREEEARQAEEDRLRRESEAARAEAKRLEEEALSAASRDEAQLLEQQAAQTNAQAEQLALDSRTVQAPVLPLERSVTPPKNVSVGKNWDGEVYDLMALATAVVARTVSIKAIQANPTWIRETAVANEDTLKIPGVRFFDKGRVTHRRPRQTGLVK